MNRLDNRGFTLVELIATLLILALVMGIGSYTITGVLKRAKEKDYNLLIDNIKDSLELYYQECKYASNLGITCNINANSFTTTLGTLVNYGFLKGNSTDSSENSVLVNPNDNRDISECEVKYTYNSGSISIEAVNPTGSCPTSY